MAAPKYIAERKVKTKAWMKATRSSSMLMNTVKSRLYSALQKLKQALDCSALP